MSFCDIAICITGGAAIGALVTFVAMVIVWAVVESDEDKE